MRVRFQIYFLCGCGYLCDSQIYFSASAVKNYVLVRVLAGAVACAFEKYLSVLVRAGVVADHKNVESAVADAGAV